MAKAAGKKQSTTGTATTSNRSARADKWVEADPYNGKNPAAVELGRLGGLKGGPARAEKLSARKRSAIARKAAQARWNNR